MMRRSYCCVCACDNEMRDEEENIMILHTYVVYKRERKKNTQINPNQIIYIEQSYP